MKPTIGKLRGMFKNIKTDNSSVLYKLSYLVFLLIWLLFVLGPFPINALALTFVTLGWISNLSVGAIRKISTILFRMLVGIILIVYFYVVIDQSRYLSYSSFTFVGLLEELLLVIPLPGYLSKSLSLKLGTGLRVGLGLVGIVALLVLEYSFTHPTHAFYTYQQHGIPIIMVVGLLYFMFTIVLNIFILWEKNVTDIRTK